MRKTNVVALTRAELKKITGGDDGDQIGKACTEDKECAANERCCPAYGSSNECKVPLPTGACPLLT